jgi:hypothetical protein
MKGAVHFMSQSVRNRVLMFTFGNGLLVKYNTLGKKQNPKLANDMDQNNGKQNITNW